MKKPRPLVLAILDGWGISRRRRGNAVYIAKTPRTDAFSQVFPSAKLEASGEAVGLPPGQMGNSEVGHLNMGAGRVVYQELTRIHKAVKEKTFFRNPVLLEAVNKATEGGALHLMGLVSDGGVHSHINHLYALLKMARENRVAKVYIHALLDGRDVPPANAAEYLEPLQKRLETEKSGELATIAGRYYTMDRDGRWQRTEKGYRALVLGEGEKAPDALTALERAYARGETDEFVLPTVLVDGEGNPRGRVRTGDAVIFFNFRPDRARQITRAFTEEDFTYFDRGANPPEPFFVCLTQYDKTIDAPVAFPPQSLKNTLGEVLSGAGLKQLRIAETEKYAHVTFFFNGGQETPYPGEERVLIPSLKVATYDLQPEMSAPKVTRTLLDKLDEGTFDVVVLNYANPDMVGHTGKLEAAVEAVETVDTCIGRVVDKTLGLGGVVFITSDHGNAELMVDSRTNGAVTAHTSNLVPFILVNKEGYRLKGKGILADVAPTVLEVLGIPIPEEMTGKSLLQKPK